MGRWLHMRAPSLALVVALLALFVALGGSGYAASQLSGPTAQPAAKKKKKSKAKRGPTGATGATGATGPSGVVAELFSGPFAGPLPTTATALTKRNGTSDLLVTFSGTGFRVPNPSPAVGIINLVIDGATKGTTQLFFNNPNEHLTLPTAQVIVKGLTAGSHTFQLTATDLTTDGNDQYRVTVLEVTPAG
jgi:hypothetical protein